MRKMHTTSPLAARFAQAECDAFVGTGMSNFSNLAYVLLMVCARYQSTPQSCGCTQFLLPCRESLLPTFGVVVVQYLILDVTQTFKRQLVLDYVKQEKLNNSQPPYRPCAHLLCRQNWASRCRHPAPTRRHPHGTRACFSHWAVVQENPPVVLLRRLPRFDCAWRMVATDTVNLCAAPRLLNTQDWRLLCVCVCSRCSAHSTKNRYGDKCLGPLQHAADGASWQMIRGFV
jgi:hypothetical protein